MGYWGWTDHRAEAAIDRQDWEDMHAPDPQDMDRVHPLRRWHESQNPDGDRADWGEWDDDTCPF